MQSRLENEPHRPVIGENIAGTFQKGSTQWKAKRRRRRRPIARKINDPNLNQTVHSGLAQEWAPEQIAGRMRLGDFEDDKVLGPAGTGNLATLVDRKWHFTIIGKIQPPLAPSLFTFSLPSGAFPLLRQA